MKQAFLFLAHLCSKFCFTGHSASYLRETRIIHEGVNGKCLLGCQHFEQEWNDSRVFLQRLEKHIFMELSSAFLDRNERKEPKDTFKELSSATSSKQSHG